MKVIHTTSTAVEKLRNRAKAIKEAEQISYMSALDRAATEAGYESWRHVQHCLGQPVPANPPAPPPEDPRSRILKQTQIYLDYLTRKGTAPVKRFPAKADAFHDVEIEGHCFRGVLTDEGPAVALYSARTRGYQRGWVQLGVAELHYTNATGTRRSWDDLAWWVCKYGPGEPRIDLSGLTAAGRYAFAREFGLGIWYISSAHEGGAGEGQIPPDAMMLMGLGGGLFYWSPAFESLSAWAKAHPSKVRAYPRSPYLGDWVTAAVTGTNPFLAANIPDEERRA